MRLLAKSIYNHKYRITANCVYRHICNKIHTNVLPWLLWYCQWLELTNRFTLPRFDTLADITVTYVR